MGVGFWIAYFVVVCVVELFGCGWVLLVGFVWVWLRYGLLGVIFGIIGLNCLLACLFELVWCFGLDFDALRGDLVRV